MGCVQGQKPIQVLQGSDREMKARIEYLWPIVH